MQPMPLWPTMFYNFDWQDHKTHAEELKAVCHDLEQKKHNSNITASVKYNLFESAFDFVTYPSPAIEAWSHWVKDCIFKASYAANKRYWPVGLNVDIELHESWCHITRDGGYHDVHIHPNSTWSCIYYLDCGNMDAATKNGLNRFYNPNNTMHTDAATLYMSHDNSIDILAEPGMMILFPSWIQHSALPYHGEKNRYVLSANSRVNKS
jgi:uncharacterized protein (TIGR02466 family)